MFEPLAGDNVMLRKDGLFRVCPLYRDRRGRLFAKYGAGFVALKGNGESSIVGLRVGEIYTEETLYVSRIGNLFVEPGGDRTLLSVEQHVLLGQKDKEQ